MSVLKLISRVKELNEIHPVLPFCFDELINALEDLDNLIELEDAKELIIAELEKILFITVFKKEKLSPKMFHTVIYGPSGCGKSSLARILARIWKSMKILEGEKKRVIFLTEEKFKQIVEQFNELYREHHKGKTNYLNNEHWKQLKTELNTILENVEELDESSKQPIVIAGRESFVAEYSGQTSQKTINFLRENKGKCIIVEESYSLYNGSSDTYGFEALSIIIRWMEEESQNNIFIFVGYRDLMLQTIFSAQKGLERRFLWVFSIKGYTPEGLSEIFSLQCKRDNLILCESINLIEFFKGESHRFPHYGGDTLRLVKACETLFYSQAFHSLFEKNQTLTKVTLEIFHKAYESYLQNQIGS